jgi:nucleoporin POM152
VAKSDLKRIQKQIQDETHDGDVVPAPITWDYKAKKPGVYRLKKVLDNYKLEVQRRTRDTYVVPCPRAVVKATPSTDRCVRDLSDMSLEVVGTPPLKIHYSRTINGKDHSFHFQSLQPDSMQMPLLLTSVGRQVVRDFDDLSWIKPAVVSVPLNETMSVPGEWKYTVAEVHDALGNMANYTLADEEQLDGPPPPGLEARFRVKERPQVHLEGCNPRQPLSAAKGSRAKLPLKVDIGNDALDASYRVAWDFSPAGSLSATGDHGDVVVAGSFTGKDPRFWPDVQEPGLYTIRSISSNGCEGEIREPSSCLLWNPPEPELSLHAEDIPDKCAGNSIGLNVDLHLVGTPPFSIRYDVVVNGREPRRERLDVRGLRYQLPLLPRQAGNHKYIFKQIDDNIYKGVPLLGREMVLEQDVKPTAQAIIQTPSSVIAACLEDEVEVDVLLIGDAPFTLEWEMFHDGKRKMEKVSGLMQDTYKIKTPPLARGGDYILALSGVQDKAGCRNSLNEEVKIAVRRQKPRAAFGLVEGRRSTIGVEGESFRMPLRLQGEEHWTVSYRNLARPETILRHRSRSGNDVLVTSEPGTWEIVSVEDDMCPGVVDPKAATFDTSWYPKPSISVVEHKSLSGTAGLYEKADICEGDPDMFEVMLSGESHCCRGFFFSFFFLSTSSCSCRRLFLPSRRR